jgi:hypothetical protein
MAFPQGPDLQEFIAGVARQLTARRISFMLIGGQAVLVHGRPRLTEDVDITLGAPPDRWRVILDVCADLSLHPLPEHVEAFVRETYVLPARHDETGLRVDFIFSTTPYEREAIGRAKRIEVAGEAVPFATAEDLIIHKLFAGRPRDVEDAVGVVQRSGAGLDWTYLGRWVAEFALVPGREDLPQRLAELRRRGLP